MPAPMITHFALVGTVWLAVAGAVSVMSVSLLLLGLLLESPCHPAAVIYLCDITNVSLSEQAFQAIRQMIVTLDLAPGAVVRDDLLQQQLGLGRTPIREALQRLVRDQFVTIIPRRGMYVSSIDVSELSTLYETRAILEPYVDASGLCPWARCRLGRDGRGARAGRDRSHAHELLEIDRECRELVWAAADNRFLTDTLDMLYAQSDRLWHLYLADVSALDHVIDEHRGDPRRVGRRRRRPGRGVDRVAHAPVQRQDRRRRTSPTRIPPRRLLISERYLWQDSHMAADVRSVTVGERTFNVVSGHHDRFWDTCEGGWEATTFDVLTDRLSTGSTFVDVGSWIGPMTLVAAACGAKVVAYEPDPGAADELTENLAANPDFDVDVRRVALWTSTGHRELRGGPVGLGESMSSFSGRAGRVGSTTVGTIDASRRGGFVADRRRGEDRRRRCRVSTGAETATLLRGATDDRAVRTRLRHSSLAGALAGADSADRPPHRTHATRTFSLLWSIRGYRRLRASDHERPHWHRVTRRHLLLHMWERELLLERT